MPRLTSTEQKLTKARKELSQLRAWKRVRIKIEDAETDQIEVLKSEIEVLSAKLQEARRRTLPLGTLEGNQGELNFLPLYISKIEHKQNSQVFHGSGGDMATVLGKRRCVLTIEACAVEEPVLTTRNDVSGKVVRREL